MEKKCPFCKADIFETFNYCPECGLALKEMPFTVSTEKQISTYVASLLIPPAGFWLGMKYLFHKEEKVKYIGIIAIMLANLSLSIIFWFAAQTIVASIHKAIALP